MTLDEFHTRLKTRLSPKQIILSDDERFHRYLQDESIQQGRAEMVLVPHNHDEVALIVQEVAALDEPWAHLTVYGMGSGLSGAAVAEGGIIVSLEKLNEIIHFDSQNHLIHVGASVTAEQINVEAQDLGLFLPCAPSSAAISSIGGNIATNASGPYSYKYGSIRRHVAKIKIVLADGQSLWVGNIPLKNSVGIDLLQLFFASEGRLGIITEAILRLTVKPPQTAMVIVALPNYVSFNDVFSKVRAYDELLACEIIDEFALKVIADKLPSNLRQGRALLMLEFGSNAQNLEFIVSELEQGLGGLFPLWLLSESHKQAEFWAIRKSITLELKKLRRYKLGEDFSLPSHNVAAFIHCSHDLALKYDLDVVVWGHAGDGNLHVNFLYDDEGRLDKIWRVIEELADTCIGLDGSLSGEHGLGRLKLPLWNKQMPARLMALHEQIVHFFDPQDRLNRHLKR